MPESKIRSEHPVLSERMIQDLYARGLSLEQVEDFAARYDLALPAHYDEIEPL